MKIQISSGQGPAECELAVGLFYAQLQKEIRDIRTVQCVRGKKPGGYASVIFETDEDISCLLYTSLMIYSGMGTALSRRKTDSVLGWMRCCCRDLPV